MRKYSSKIHNFPQECGVAWCLNSKKVIVAFLLAGFCLQEDMLEMNVDTLHIFLFYHNAQHLTTMAILSGSFAIHQLFLAA